MRLAEIDFGTMEEWSRPKRWGAGDPSQDRRIFCAGERWYKVWEPDYIRSQSYIADGKYVSVLAAADRLLGFAVGFFDAGNASALLDFIYDDNGVLRGYVTRQGTAVSQIPRPFLEEAANRSITCGWVMADVTLANVVEIDGGLSFIDFDSHFCELDTLNIAYERERGCLSSYKDPYFAGLIEGHVAATRQRSAANSEPVLGTPAVGKVRFGDLRRLQPISARWGLDRGRPLDRFYIDRFIRAHGDDIRGRVLEVGDDGYVEAFNHGSVTRIDVLDRRPEAGTSIVGDIADLPQVPDESFDCIVLTQALQFVLDVGAAIATCHRILRPGGVVLATMPGISHISHDPADVWKDFDLWCWSFSQRSLRMLFERTFGPGNAAITGHGNVLAAISFLEGLVIADLTQEELEHRDPDYDLIITVRAVKGPKSL